MRLPVQNGGRIVNDMLTVTNNAIYLTRGDSAYLNIDLKDESGNSYTPAVGDKLYFRVKQGIFGSKLKVEKEIPIDTLTLEIEPADTVKLSFTTYRYEIELVTISGQCFTVVENGALTIGPELEDHT